MLNKLTLLGFIFIGYPLMGAEAVAIAQPGSIVARVTEYSKKYAQTTEIIRSQGKGVINEVNGYYSIPPKKCITVVEGHYDVSYTRHFNNAYGWRETVMATYNPITSEYRALKHSYWPNSKHALLKKGDVALFLTTESDKKNTIESNENAKFIFLDLEKNYFEIVARKQADSKKVLLARLGIRSNL